MIKKKTFKFCADDDKTNKILIVFEDPYIYLYTTDGNFTLKYHHICAYYYSYEIVYETEDLSKKVTMAYTTWMDRVKGNTYPGSVLVSIYNRDYYYSWNTKRYILSNYEQRYKFNILLFNKMKELDGIDK